MRDSESNSTEIATRRRRGPRTVIALIWCVVGMGGALWLGAPGALVSVAGGATGGLLRAAGVRTGSPNGRSAVAVNDALIAPDFTLRLHPSAVHLGPDDRTMLDVHLGSILGLEGRASLRAIVTTAAGGPARGVRIHVRRFAAIGGVARLAVATRGANFGLDTLTVTATYGSLTHVTSAPIQIS